MDWGLERLAVHPCEGRIGDTIECAKHICCHAKINAVRGKFKANKCMALHFIRYDMIR